jgi:hypothetical protein
MKKIENAGKFAKQVTEAHSAILKAIPSFVYEEDMQNGIIGNKNLPKLMEEMFQKIYPKNEVGKSFTVGQIFRHRDPNCVPQWHGDNFKKLVRDASERVISISRAKQKLSDYVLSKNMNSTEIQNATKSTPIEENVFWLILYLLVIEPKLGKEVLNYELREDKYYIFHVRWKSGKVDAVNVRWDFGGWNLVSREFVYDGEWFEGNVFLSPAIA